MFVNTQLFREAALHYKKYGRYCDDPPGSPGYYAYWSEQLRRCIEGYSVGGQRVTGDHYHYLNFCRIKLTESKRGDGVIKKQTQGKVVNFPDFWDGDHFYYTHLEKAAQEGKHLILAKARRKGYSYKNSAKAANTYNTVPNSLTLLCAHDKKFLYPEGIMKMAKDNLDFMNEHTAWKKRRLIDKQDIVKAGFKESSGGQEIDKGYKSSILALTFKDNPDAARGKDASFIIFEEAGAFDNLKDAYMATRPCVEDGGVTTGTIVVFGTGGDMEGGTVDFESMFYDPDAYNLLPVENEWDEGAHGTFCGLFIPSYLNKVGYMDSEGNSLKEEARNAEQEKRDHVKMTAKDAGVYDKLTTEYPFCPAEAFRQLSGNVFPKALLEEHANDLKRTGLPQKIRKCGFFHRNRDGRVIFKPDPDARPIDQFPHDKTGNTHGCIVMYEDPYRVDGKIPDGLYTIRHDPYAQDGGTGGSLGAAYVKKHINPYSQPDDLDVAHWVGRPKTQDEYNHQLFLMAEYYNAKIGFENDRGEVIPYAKRIGKISQLRTEPEIFDKNSGHKFKKLGRNYGCSMGSEERKGQAEIYLRDWLLTPRGITESGKQLYNLHYIYDIPFLSELIRYNRKGNFDRVSAHLVGTFFDKADHNKTVEPVKAEATTDSFFNRTFFQ